MKKPRIINIVGRSGSGKTTLVEKLIAFYSARGLRVSAVKSMRHDFDIDHPGKDSHRYRQAGAHTSIIANREKFALVADLDPGRTPFDLAGELCADSDIVIIEGYREGLSVKVEVIGDSDEEPLYKSGIEGIALLVSDRTIDSGLPCFRRNDLEGIVSALDDVCSAR
jgi:molybdopterin-guanine dinucleotide biosynthesis protein B